MTNKLPFLFAILFSANAFAYELTSAQEFFIKKQSKMSNMEVAFGGGHGCGVNGTDFFCWGYFSSRRNLPKIQKETKLVGLFEDSGCTFGSEGLYCFGYEYGNTLRQVHSVKLQQPLEIQLGSGFGCALEKTKVVCWGENTHGQLDVPELKNPRQLAVGQHHVCVLDQDNVICWGGEGSDYSFDVVPKLKSPQLVVSQDDSSCAVDQEGVKCWGWLSQLNVSSEFRDIKPKYLSIHYNRVCALMDKIVKCLMIKPYDAGLEVAEYPLPSFGLRNPRKFVSSFSFYGYYKFCAVDDEGLKCWGSGEYLQNPQKIYLGKKDICISDGRKDECRRKIGDDVSDDPLSLEGLQKVYEISSRKVQEGYVFSCALESAEIECWTKDQGKTLSIPSFVHPTDLAVGSHFACALDQGQAVCWGTSPYAVDFLEIPELENPRSIHIAGRSVCVLEDRGLICWGGEANLPRFAVVNPRFLTSDGESFCAIDDWGVKCWGNMVWIKLDKGQSVVSDFFSHAVPTAPLLKSRFLTNVKKNLLSGSWNQPLVHRNEGYEKTILALQLLSPAIESGSSPIYLNEIIPRFQKLKLDLQISIEKKQTQFNDLQEKSVALQIMKEVLDVSEPLFTWKEKHSFLLLKQKIASALLKGVDRSSLQEIVDLEGGVRPVIQELSISSKTEFLADIWNLCAEVLK